MKAKKLAALGLSAALSLSLASPAFASSNKTTKITGTYQEIPIAVTVPTTGTATINPYGLPVKVMGTAATNPKELASISGQKITTMPMAIYSKTEVGLMVGATVTGEIKGENLKLAAAPIPDGTTTNTALVYLETKASNQGEAKLAKADSETKFGPFEGWDSAGSAVDATVVNEVKNWASTTYDANARNQILVGTTTKTKDAIGYLTAAKDTGKYTDAGVFDTDNGGDGTLDLQKGGAMWFRLAGDVVANPKTAWTRADGVTVTVAFTFTPTTSAGSPGTIKVPASISASTSQTTKVTFEIDAAQTHMTFGSDATYSWAIANADDTASGAATFDTTDSEETATPKVSFSAAGTYNITLTVTENNVPYVATATVTVAA